jgi:hypothetical protein
MVGQLVDRSTLAHDRVTAKRVRARLPWCWGKDFAHRNWLNLAELAVGHLGATPNLAADSCRGALPFKAAVTACEHFRFHGATTIPAVAVRPIPIPGRLQARLDHMPEAMTIRRQTVEHPFGTLKAWMSSTHFLTGTLEKVKTEMSLQVLAYSMKRMINLFGVKPLMQAMAA